MATIQKITNCLWFDGQAEQAANFYISVFKNGKINRISYYGIEGQEIHGQKSGSVLTVEFELNGQSFMALNGGPDFKFSEAISFMIQCETQQEIDYYWEKLNEGGDPKAQQCGWVKDKFGLSWQITPTILLEMEADPDREKADKVIKAMLNMKKLDIAELKTAYNS
jgi:predicted 3-demethylubiquinone-9 3-methyltransferase (glyoxalase superfamily)